MGVSASLRDRKLKDPKSKLPQDWVPLVFGKKIPDAHNTPTCISGDEHASKFAMRIAP